MKDKLTTADLIIDFLGNLQGVDQLMSMVEEPRTAVIDLNTAAIIEADPGFPDGDMLIHERADGVKSRVHTFKLLEPLFLRHAYQVSITEGGTTKEHYHHITEHFRRKTGYGN